MQYECSPLVSSDQMKDEKDHQQSQLTYTVRKWQVIMWKNLIVRSRHWFITLLEVVIPILLFWMVAWARQNNVFGQKAQDVPAANYSMWEQNALNDYSFIHHDSVNLAYAPDTPFTRKVIAELNKTLVHYLENNTKLESFDAVSSELKLEELFHLKYANKSTFTNYIGYGIVFENVGNSTDIPTDFKYKIRCTVPRWNTKDIFPQFLPAGPSDETHGYIFKGFLAVQMAMDNAFISVATQKPPLYNMSVQEFPFPAYKVDIFNELFKSLMPFITMISFITISISVIKKVVEEKTSGVKELMKMMGLQNWMVWAGWVLNGWMVYIPACVAITLFLCHEFDVEKGPVIAYVHFTVVFVLFFMFCTASIFFCFAVSAFFMRPTIAMTTGMTLWLLLFSMLQQYVGRVTIPLPLYLIMCLVPMFNMCSGYVIIAAFESRQVTINWLNLLSDPNGGNGLSLGGVMFMFLVQMVVYMFITWYVSSIHPGPYGRAEPWYFIFQKCMRKRTTNTINLSDDDEEVRYESPPKNFNVGMQIRDLRKVFNGNMVAVDKVNLDIYEGQITALLGHNGAGKTTTMSIITGMYSPSSGSVYAGDYNIFEDMDRFRSSLGLCPQHDLLFPYLTAIEHLIFFGMLKGLTRAIAISDGLKLLQMLNITEKRYVLADKLSGGMKRKLSLAIALIGSPKVLILDEPTSGMDPESRREMWDLLLKLRTGRTIMITTHFMEEADVLGDRIAIMDHGKVKCYGSTLFLKRHYGTGYQLTLMKAAHSPVEPITTTIQSRVEGAELKSEHPTQVVYNLPQERAASLPAMFAEIEGHKAKLGVTNMGISCTTMEEVFLKVGKLAKEERDEFDKTSSHSQGQNPVLSRSNEALTHKKVKGLALMVQQFKSLVLKRSLFTIRRPVASIIFFLIPLLMTWLTVRNGMVDVAQTSNDPSLQLELSMYGDTNVYMTGPYNQTDIYKGLVTKEGSMGMTTPPDIVGALLNLGKENIANYKTKVIVAANFIASNKTAVAMFNGIAYHSAPISVNLVSNTLLQSRPETSTHTITTTNHPLDLENFVGACSLLNEFSLYMSALVWLILVPMGVKGFIMDFIAFPHNERTSNAKQLQLMTGVPPPNYWAACFVWDYLTYLASCLAMFLVIMLSDSFSLFSETKDYTILLLILGLYGVSGICCTYLYSFLGKSSTMAGSVFTFITLITGLIAPLVMHFLVRLKEHALFSSALLMPLNYLLCLDPQFAFGSAVFNFAYLLAQRSACNSCNSNEVKNGDMCSPAKEYLEFGSETNPNGIMTFVLFLALDWLLYMGIIMLIEYGYMGQLVHKVKVLWVGKDFDRIETEDSDVRDERDQIDATRDKQDDAVILTVDDLAKKFSRSFAAVQGVSFRVSAGECFGLLGVNGAGKTTTFRMLTGDENPTAGSARILHYDLINNRSKYLAQIGYCPQFDGINGFLTGEEMLRLFANLRGIPKSRIQYEIDALINRLGLEEYKHRRCGKYSGGNKRKLSTAMALIGEPAVVFLDEPTSGVDPVARRNLWDVLGQCQKQGQAIVLTSHSMEECEALCTRLTIMARGRMKCIGSNQYLKKRYGQGYTVMIKLDTKHNKGPQFVTQLKSDMDEAFLSQCTLKDEHKSLLHYQIGDTNLLLSELFSKMETLKGKNSVIEDYTVGDTTLEQVFIAFARQTDDAI